MNDTRGSELDPQDYEFEREYDATDSGRPVSVCVSKVGGGTLGRAYEGDWQYLVYNEGRGVIAEGSDLHTGTPKTHEQAAALLLGMITA